MSEETPTCPKCGSRSNMILHGYEWVCHATHPIDKFTESKEKNRIPADKQEGFWTSPSLPPDSPVLEDHGEGWYLVLGLRHRAVAKAESAERAVEMANEAELVDTSWESPVTHFLGAELPEVFGV